MTRTALMLLALLVSACQTDPASPPSGPVPDEAWVQSVLRGSPAACDEDAQCASGVCQFGNCAGALAVDQRWLQEELARRLAEGAARSPEARALVVAGLAAIAEDVGAEGARTRGRAAFVASFLPGEEATAFLVGLLDDPSPIVRREVALALASRGDDRALTQVLLDLHDGAARWRAEAARALGGLRSDRAVDALTAALSDESRFVQQNAIESLGRIGDRRAIRPLVDILRDGAEPHHAIALAALRAITGERLGLDPGEWERLE